MNTNTNTSANTSKGATLYRYTDGASGLLLHIAVFDGTAVDVAELEKYLRPLELLAGSWFFDGNTPMSTDERVRIGDDMARRGWTILGSEHRIN